MEPDPDGATPSSPQSDGHLDGTVLIDVQGESGSLVRSWLRTTIESDEVDRKIQTQTSKSCKNRNLCDI